MRTFKRSLLSAGLLGALGLLLPAGAYAKVSAEEAQKLKNGELTPMGAEMAGNADGSIPKWEGGLLEIPMAARVKAKALGYECVDGDCLDEKSSFARGKHLLDPFPDDKPLFTITNANLDEYKEFLSTGQIALFKFFDDYKMPIYQTRRTAGKKQFVYDEIFKNATTAELVDNGEGIAGARVGVPFPIPKSGREVIWNHKVRYRGVSVRRWNNQFPVTSNGSFSAVRLQEDVFFVYSDPTATREALTANNVIIYFLQIIRKPARLAGSILMVHETANQVEETRRAWLYNSGSRRVRRAPNVGYDNPGTGSDGLRTNDQFDMYNGATDRYTWKLVGKREMYIPYNAYRIHSPELKYTDIIKPRHINQDLTRYEKHRVWVVEAEVRDGTSHIYGKRTFYVDEDTWQIAAVDNYDQRGELWRVQEGHQIQAYDPKYYVSQLIIAHPIYDLQNSRYLTIALSNEDDEVSEIEDEIEDPRKYFNPRTINRFAFK